MCELYHCSELPDSCWGPESKVGLGYAYNALCSSNLNVDELSGKAFNQALHSFFLHRFVFHFISRTLFNFLGFENYGHRQP